MIYEYKHYGKTLNKLTDKEKELLTIDTSMTLMFKMKHEKNIEKSEVLFTQMINDISIKRTKIILDILDINEKVFTTTIQKLDYIETTEYGYDKFLKDVELNLKNKEITERLSALN